MPRATGFTPTTPSTTGSAMKHLPPTGSRKVWKFSPEFIQFCPKQERVLLEVRYEIVRLPRCVPARLPVSVHARSRRQRRASREIFPDRHHSDSRQGPLLNFDRPAIGRGNLGLHHW